MIEPTDEMVAAFERGGTGGWGDITDTRAGLAAVLAIVERGRRAECGAAGPDGKWCVRMPHRPSEYHGWVGDGELVRW